MKTNNPIKDGGDGSFKLLLDCDCFSKGYLIDWRVQLKSYWKLFLQFIGCTPSYQLIVLEKPTKTISGWSYPVKIKNKNIRLFGIIIKRTKYE